MRPVAIYATQIIKIKDMFAEADDDGMSVGVERLALTACSMRKLTRSPQHEPASYF